MTMLVVWTVYRLIFRLAEQPQGMAFLESRLTLLHWLHSGLGRNCLDSMEETAFVHKHNERHKSQA